MEEAAATGLRGRPLRRASMVLLLRAGHPMTITDVLEALEREGRTVGGKQPHKTLADALGYEVRRGWLVRVRRGTYAVGRVSRTSRWRLFTQPG